MTMILITSVLPKIPKATTHLHHSRWPSRQWLPSSIYDKGSLLEQPYPCPDHFTVSQHTTPCATSPVCTTSWYQKSIPLHIKQCNQHMSITQKRYTDAQCLTQPELAQIKSATLQCALPSLT